MKSDSFVSVVMVQHKPLAALESVLLAVHGELDRNFSDYETVIIGQGGGAPYTPADEAVLLKIPSLRYIQLSSVVQPDVAWAAALENAIGDFVVMFDPCSDPVPAISGTVALCRSGFDVVVGAAAQEHTLPYRLARAMAERILLLVDYALPKNATGLRCLSRRAVNSVTHTGRFYHQLSMRIQHTGYPQAVYAYELLPAGKRTAGASLSGGVRRLLRLLVFNSSKPLRWMSALGLFGSLSAFVFAAYSILVHFILHNVVEGWTTTIFFMSALFMMQFIMLAFFGEYLGRLLDDRSEQADYSVVFEKNSSIMVNKDRVNVFAEALPACENLVQTGRKN